MKYEDYNKLEKIFDDYPDDLLFKDALVNKIKVNDKKIDTLLTYHTFYYKMREYWKYMKVRKASDTLNVECDDDIEKVVSEIKLSLKEGKYNHINLRLENKTYDNIDLLNEFEDILYIKYSDNPMACCHLDEFKMMRSTIDYYKNLIDENDLSPLEIITYAYDLLKSMGYQESEENKALSRAIHLIIKSGNIVCVGYSLFLMQLLSEYGIKAYTLDVVDKDNPNRKHTRLMIRVIDEKYDLNGAFAFDPTFDSAKGVKMCINSDKKVVVRDSNNPVRDNEKIMHSLDDMCLYKYFLVPINQYGKVFKYDILESSKDINNNQILSKENAHIIQYGFTSVPRKNIDLSLFIKLMYNVKLAEGFPKEDMVKYIDDLLLVNELSTSSQKELIKRIISEIEIEKDKRERK